MTLLLLSPAWATDVLLPAATPASVSDFSVAYMISDLVVNALEDRGLDVDDDGEIGRWAGGDAVGCFDNPACPQILFGRTDARIAVVLGVEVRPDGFDIEARLIPAGDEDGEIMREFVPAGQETRFAARVAEVVAARVPELPPRAMPMRAGDPAEPPEEEEPPARVAPVEKKVEKKAEAKADLSVEGLQKDKKARAEQAQLGLPWPVYARYRQSGKSWPDWRRAELVRTGRVWLALGGGIAYGDTGRAWSVRQYIDLDDGVVEVMEEASLYGATVGMGGSFGGEVGYAPAWWAEVDVWVGAQMASKSMDSGWECYEGCVEQSALNPYGTVDAVQLWVEPRFKGVLVPTGYVKPHLLLGAAVVGTDGFHVPDEGSSVDFPDDAARIAIGPSFGAGLGVDPIPNLGIVLEGSYTYFLTGTSEIAGDAGVFSTPPDDWGGPLPGVIRGSLLIGTRL